MNKKEIKWLNNKYKKLERDLKEASDLNHSKCYNSHEMRIGDRCLECQGIIAQLELIEELVPSLKVINLSVHSIREGCSFEEV
jgi:hypothetical protein